MDFATNTEEATLDLKINQENILLGIVKELCRGSDDRITSKLKGKIASIIADCDLKHHTSLQRVSTADESTSTVLGFMHQTSAELTYDEQIELNQALIANIEKKLPIFNSDLEKLKKNSATFIKLREDQQKELKDKENKLEKIQEQESEQMELMMEWLNHRIRGITNYGDNSSELLNLKVKIINLKSKILHLQVLQNIFTETNQSLKAYSEIHKDLNDSIKETEIRIKKYQEITESDIA